ncbi:inositol 2-dehydrogenase [Pseudoteredinibacter isoporae]|uniref:Myo-inositol 2-dehydrogenase/D-chiro-inositol 1-dehydrogenase n=1 Tax=Pseudoteredinibacter isoporae TaxID=570281 RepID=A0A7X0MYX3_9GAMM|nr:inositol 2-dehydrogenase [Pseudoteredinibacter isoporae]MBB6522527.1 myo-inositol 2-dehydrogenase/D-chiro-inositol 1-dehydrogenase [Pseudoteredinibacter isoporae]NHO88057.1 inositol 2-dehydrogenase [Pseudoteredinibacter isoporae]NIB23612.1 inositol 2-dehydrogenase [Pseudoteredinibacter isoporae]
MISIALFGAGRIGSLHGANVARRDDVELRYVSDVFPEAAQKLADKFSAQVVSIEEALADSSLDAVIIASSTDTHAQLIEASAKAGKAIFCEKPIDLDIQQVEACLAVVEETGVALSLGFNRRFDINFRALQQAVAEQKIGNLEMVSITSRDPSPPPVDYIKVSGGLFRDMMIHDLDMARWLLGEEPSEVFATASCLVNPEIEQAGDVDTAMVILKTPSGRMCQISNSRRAAYGYDQRIEVFGSAGMMRAENAASNTVELFTEAGVRKDNPPHFFLERYMDAYQRELDEFVDAIVAGVTPSVGGNDGRMALVLADAALQSYQTGVPVKL